MSRVIKLNDEMYQEAIKNADKTDYWANITDIADKQRRKGIERYGQRLEDNRTLTDLEMLTYAQEEAVDLLFYLEDLKSRWVKRNWEAKLP